MNIQSTESSNGFANSNVSQTDTRIGWTVGAGLDYALPAGWSLRAEYLYVKIPSYTTFSPGNGPGYATFGWITNLNNSLSENIVRFGVNYKFY
jgi:outer membrane immunogenic protein